MSGYLLVFFQLLLQCFHMGTIHVNLSQAIRIGQGNHIRIKLSQKLPIQVDGEPWLQVIIHIHIHIISLFIDTY
jgi:diacylglycerol kinase family enzyme